MKRGGPLKRRTPLRSGKPLGRPRSGAGAVLTCAREGCGREFYVGPSEIARRKFCSNECRRLAGARVLSAEAKLLGSAASGRVRRAKGGIPEDAPRDAQGYACVEKVCQVCEQPFLAQWAHRLRRQTCSFTCANVLRRQRYKDRKGKRNPNYRHGGRSGVRDREGERRWFAALGTKCAVPGCPGIGRLALHHVIYRQKIRRVGGDVWDPRDALTLCNSCHGRHHQRGRPVPLALLANENYEFAWELLGSAAYDYLRRRYSGEDPRLDTLLTR